MKYEITVLLFAAGLVLCVFTPVPFVGIGMIIAIVTGIYLAWLALSWVVQKAFD